MKELTKDEALERLQAVIEHISEAHRDKTTTRRRLKELYDMRYSLKKQLEKFEDGTTE